MREPCRTGQARRDARRHLQGVLAPPSRARLPARSDASAQATHRRAMASRRAEARIHRSPEAQTHKARLVRRTRPRRVARRNRRARLAQDLRRGGAERLCERARHPCAWRRVAPLGEFAFRRDLAAPHRAHSRNAAAAESLRSPVLRRNIWPSSTWRDFATALLDAHPDMATRALRPSSSAFPGATTKMDLTPGRRAYWLSDRRRRHAAIVAYGIFAQPRAHDRRFLSRQAPAHRLAAWRGMVLGHADRRRSGQ